MATMDESHATRWDKLPPKVRKWAMLLAAAVIGLVVGLLLRPAAVSRQDVVPTASQPASQESHVQLWTCSMHPDVILPRPGQCPKCGMTLIPLTTGDQTVGLRRLTVSPEAKALMDVETAPVERRFATAEIRMTGKVAFDETKQATISAWVPGRLDRLYVDYTGITVRKGDHMVLLYSPELLSTQTELLQAISAVKNLSSSEVDIVRQTAEATVTAVREKLRLLGLTAEQIAEVERTGKVEDHVTIYSPVGGIVVRKDALEGQYVTTGTPIYTIVDLAGVWVKLDAYESDLMWLRYGQKVQFTAVSYPGETFSGTIAFIDPVLDERTRTVKVRLDVPNPDGRLKPEMFVKAIVQAHIAAEGKVMDPDLAGKWICPMHPSVIRDHSGACDICGMPLVTAESLGYVSETAATEKPLVIPASAVLLTGTRAVVYVEVPGTDKPTFEGREILLGPRAGDDYLVRSGLEEGQRVVVRGNFKIDSALQIQARPSMMSPQGGPVTSHRHGPTQPPPAETPPAGGEPAPASEPAGGHRHD
jgi:Cu(I)/Ag(I) efflux system membrane fusion protein